MITATIMQNRYKSCPERPIWLGRWRPCAGRYLEPAVSGQREPVAHHLPARGLHRRRTAVGGEVGLGREPPRVAYPVPMIFAASMGPMPKISVRVVPEASTSASMRSFRSAIF